jgi:hypothetical protein
MVAASIPPEKAAETLVPDETQALLAGQPRMTLGFSASAVERRVTVRRSKLPNTSRPNLEHVVAGGAPVHRVPVNAGASPEVGAREERPRVDGSVSCAPADPARSARASDSATRTTTAFGKPVAASVVIMVLRTVRKGSAGGQGHRHHKPAH